MEPSQRFSDFSGINHVRRFITGGAWQCELCTDYINGLEPMVNHMLEDHGYRLLFVGSEHRDGETLTVMVVGDDETLVDSSGEDADA